MSFVPAYWFPAMRDFVSVMYIPDLDSDAKNISLKELLDTNCHPVIFLPETVQGDRMHAVITHVRFIFKSKLNPRISFTACFLDEW